jgi:hypothetical protein
MTMRKSESTGTRVLLGLVAVLTRVALWPAPSGQAASPADVKDRGVFVLTMAGKQIGTETFEIRSKAGNVEAEAQIELRLEQEGKKVEFKTSATLLLTPELQPLSYEWTQKGTQSSHLQIDLRASPAAARYRTVTGEEDVREFSFQRGIIILDNNVIHHYQLAVHRFRIAGGGKQTFPAFIPQEALPGSLNLEDVGPETETVAGREQMLQHLVMTTDNARIELWVDSRDRLQKISIPAAELEVTRKK